jgi:hypothetical protein
MFRYDPIFPPGTLSVGKALVRYGDPRLSNQGADAEAALAAAIDARQAAIDGARAINAKMDQCGCR